MPTTLKEFAAAAQQVLSKTQNLSHLEIQRVELLRGIKAPRELYVLGKVSRGCFSIPASSTTVASPAKIKNDVGKTFTHLTKLIELIAHSKIKSLMIFGPPGTGKTHVTFETLTNAKLVKNEDYVVIKGRITPISLYMNLFLLRDDKLIVFDDCDAVFESQQSVNYLKAALDSYEERRISWFSPFHTVNVSTMSNAEKETFYQDVEEKLRTDPGNMKIKYPSEFPLTSRVIFISNNLAKEIDPAIMSRSHKINVTLTTEELFYRIESVLPHIDSGLSTPKKLEVLKRLKTMTANGEIFEPSFRTFISACDLVKSKVKNWEEFLEYC